MPIITNAPKSSTGGQDLTTCAKVLGLKPEDTRNIYERFAAENNLNGQERVKFNQILNRAIETWKGLGIRNEKCYTCRATIFGHLQDIAFEELSSDGRNLEEKVKIYPDWIKCEESLIDETYKLTRITNDFVAARNRILRLVRENLLQFKDQLKDENRPRFVKSVLGLCADSKKLDEFKRSDNKVAYLVNYLKAAG